MTLAIPELLAAKTAESATPQGTWRGFNLIELYQDNFKTPISANDFAFMREWGFNYARIPMNYWLWGNRNSWSEINASFFKSYVDPIVKYAADNNIHVTFSLHRAPGYCVNRRDLEPADLFKGPQADRKRAAAGFRRHWQFIAERYANISSDTLSFNLLNEPPFMENQNDYVNILQPVIRAIRQTDSGRKIIIDGLNLGRRPIRLQNEKNIVQSLHAYAPSQFTHYNFDTWRTLKAANRLQWPFTDTKGEKWTPTRLKREYRGWTDYAGRGGKVLVGEWGVTGSTPHGATLSFMEDQLRIWKDNNWGWALWNLRGTFGVMDSGRKDVKYESYKGHQLDREMLSLLQRY